MAPETNESGGEYPEEHESEPICYAESHSKGPFCLPEDGKKMYVGEKYLGMNSFSISINPDFYHKLFSPWKLDR